jgi:CRP/FNR family cyclic AMP-dependent transcriptional regulator
MLESKYLKATVENVQTLMEIPMLKDFEPWNIRDLLTQSKIRKYEDGEEIIKEGDNDRWFYFLLKGKVRIVKAGEELAILRGAGDIFGEMSLIGTSIRSTSVFSMGETTCIATDASIIDKLLGNDKIALCYILYRAFSIILAERLKATSADLVNAKKELIKLKANKSN